VQPQVQFSLPGPGSKILVSRDRVTVKTEGLGALTEHWVSLTRPALELCQQGGLVMVMTITALAGHSGLTVFVGTKVQVPRVHWAR
jgi:hypothetical protein